MWCGAHPDVRDKVTFYGFAVVFPHFGESTNRRPDF